MSESMAGRKRHIDVRDYTDDRIDNLLQKPRFKGKSKSDVIDEALDSLSEKLKTIEQGLHY